MTMVWLRGNGGKSYFGCAESFCSELIHRAGVKFFSPEPYNSLTFTDALNWVKHAPPRRRLRGRFWLRADVHCPDAQSNESLAVFAAAEEAPVAGASGAIPH
jgi:hypothetical protein